MLNQRSIAFSLISFFSMCGLANANTIFVSVSGQFGSAVTSDSYASAGTMWQLGFNVDDHPVAANTDTLGFDVPFSNLGYNLGGTAVPLPVSAIRFSSLANLGLFSVFFGPESGFFSDGTAVPEFSFEGPQVFMGTTTTPVLNLGQFPVNSWTFSDALNFDNHLNASSTVAIAPTPEPSTLCLLIAPVILYLVRRKHPFSSRGL